MRRKYSSRRANSEPDYHKMSLDELEAVFNTSLRSGMDETRAAKLRLKRGHNQLTYERHQASNKARATLKYLMQDLCGLQWFTCACSALVYFVCSGDAPDLTNLLICILSPVIVLIAASMYIYQDVEAARQLSRIHAASNSQQMVTVVRNGEEKQVSGKELVVGDLIHLSAGQRVPADVRIVDIDQRVEFDRSPLNGEFERVLVDSLDASDRQLERSANIALKSSLLVCGEVKALVVRKGDDTHLGRLNIVCNNMQARVLNLDVEMNNFAILIIVFSAVMAVVMATWMLTFVRIAYPSELTVNALVQNVVTMLTMFVPNVLPITLAASLLVIRKRMRDAGVYLKSAACVEATSGMNVLACDKTGTLTCNKMTVANVSAGIDVISLKEMKSRGNFFSYLIFRFY